MNGVQMVVTVKDQTFTVTVPYEGDNKMFSDCLTDSFYGIADRVMQEMGIEEG